MKVWKEGNRWYSDTPLDGSYSNINPVAGKKYQITERAAKMRIKNNTEFTMLQDSTEEERQEYLLAELLKISKSMAFTVERTLQGIRPELIAIQAYQLGLRYNVSEQSGLCRYTGSLQSFDWESSPIRKRIYYYLVKKLNLKWPHLVNIDNIFVRVDGKNLLAMNYTTFYSKIPENIDSPNLLLWENFQDFLKKGNVSVGDLSTFDNLLSVDEISFWKKRLKMRAINHFKFDYPDADPFLVVAIAKFEKNNGIQNRDYLREPYRDTRSEIFERRIAHAKEFFTHDESIPTKSWNESYRIAFKKIYKDRTDLKKTFLLGKSEDYKKPEEPLAEPYTTGGKSLDAPTSSEQIAA